MEILEAEEYAQHLHNSAWGIVLPINQSINDSIILAHAYNPLATPLMSELPALSTLWADLSCPPANLVPRVSRYTCLPGLQPSCAVNVFHCVRCPVLVSK